MITNTISLKDDHLVILFPFHRPTIEVIKTIEGYRYDPGLRHWKLPYSPWHCQQVLEKLQPLGFMVADDVSKAANREHHAPISTKPVLPKGLYNFQKEGVEFMQSVNGRIILADSMGLGKTITSLAYMKMESGRTLIIAPASVVYKWEQECKKWLPKWRTQIISTGKQEIEDVHILIMSYAMAVAKFKTLESMDFDTMICDEAHAVKSYKAQRSRVVKALCRTGIPHILFLSGTPFVNRPGELFPLLNMLQPDQFPSFMSFAKRYMGAQYIDGFWIIPPDVLTNSGELVSRLKGIMLRRTQEMVGLELPDLTRSYVPVVMAKGAAYKAELKDVRAWLKSKGREVRNPAHVLTRLNLLRQMVGDAKAAPAVELAEGVLQEGRQVVLFAHHKAVIEAISKDLKKYGVKMITGDTPQRERQHNIDMFLMKDSSIRVMIISTAGAEGIDLYAASDIIFVEREWTPAKEEQAEARLHRIGQKNPVTAHYLVVKGTVDEKLDGIVRRKRELFGQIIQTDEILEELVEALEME